MPEAYVSAKDILSGQFDRQSIEGKIALFGTDAVGLGGFSPTPISSAMAHVEIHRQIIESMLTGQFLKRPAYIHAAELSIVFIAGLLLIFVVPILSIKTGAFYSMAVMGLTVGVSYYMFVSHKFLLDASLPLLICCLIFMVHILLQSIRIETKPANSV